MIKSYIPILNYDYTLDSERIAKYPLTNREHSRLLVYSEGTISGRQFYELPELLPAGLQLVFNNTRVIYARIPFQKSTGANIEIFCLTPLEPSDYSLIFQQKNTCTWKCLVGNLKKWKSGTLSGTFETKNLSFILTAEKLRSENGKVEIRFNWNGDLTFGELLDQIGIIPIPPYLERPSEEQDKTSYQTVYSKLKGSVAAPTAGLHFTDELLKNINNKGIKTAELTLHVGAGTFQPVKEANVANHPMHEEFFAVNRSTLLSLMESENRNIAVGTTSLRTLESIYWIGVKILSKKNNTSPQLKLDQWEWKVLPGDIPVRDSLTAILNFLDQHGIEDLISGTRLMIVPGYSFKMIQGLITNFHQPKSTLLLLVAAFIGEDWKKIYDYALLNNYRFLSYGDSSLLLPKIM
ncbi:MAG: S-adenosylmethionine:tRNA ribosyltransferase-isomerase [Bacteroidales bacterium]|nr:S-adenosylmethionine:tRNA ribosyltransferase-isomerase [Bacteroidales bacterium]